MLPLVVLKKKILLKIKWVMKEKMKNIICKTVIFLCVMLLCAGIGGNYDVKNVQAKTVVREITIGKGKSYALSEDFTISKKVSYKTSNKKVATVTSRGKITAKKTGKARIIITLVSGKKAVVNVTVQKTAVKTKKISGLKKSVVLKRRQKLTLKPVISPLTSVEKVTYKTSNKKVATVSNKGVITAKKKGSAKITVKSGKKSYTVTVKVK